MSEGVRPKRPSRKDPAVLAEKFTRRPSRLAVRMDKATLKAIKRAATDADRSIKRFVLDALRDKGVEIAAIDLNDDADDE